MIVAQSDSVGVPFFDTDIVETIDTGSTPDLLPGTAMKRPYPAGLEKDLQLSAGTGQTPLFSVNRLRLSSTRFWKARLTDPSGPA